MANWLKETNQNIQILKEKKYFNDWQKLKTKFIIFYLYPNMTLSPDWIKKRTVIYQKNAKKLNVMPPKINFFIFPNKETGKKIGIIPAIALVSKREIYGHLNQSPGHELTHILLGEVNSPSNLPANGLWSEGICTYFDGTNTDRRKHTNSLGYPKEIFAISWQKWRKNFPDDLYPFAGSIIQYLHDQFGWKSITSFLKELKNSGRNDNESAKQIFKLPLKIINKNWQIWLKDGYSSISGKL